MSYVDFAVRLRGGCMVSGRMWWGRAIPAVAPNGASDAERKLGLPVRGGADGRLLGAGGAGGAAAEVGWWGVGVAWVSQVMLVKCGAVVAGWGYHVR